MTTTEFQILLNKLHKAHRKYADLLKEAEKEYENRYGVDTEQDDNWVDSFHISPEPLKVKDLDKNNNYKLTKTN